MSRRRGFSLVELAVVAGLVAVLLTVLFEMSHTGTQASTKGITRLDSVMKANRFCEQLKHVMRTAKVVRASYPKPFETHWTIDYVAEVDEHTLAHRDAHARVSAKPLIVNGQPGVELSFQKGIDRPITYAFPEAQLRVYGARKLLAAQLTLEANDRHAFAVGSPYFDAAQSNLEPPEAAVVDLLEPPPGLLVGGRIKAGRTGAALPPGPAPAPAAPLAAPAPIAPGLPPIARGASPAPQAVPPVASFDAAAPPSASAAPPSAATTPPVAVASSSLADSFPAAGFGPSRPPVTALPAPVEDAPAWNGASAIDPASEAATAASTGPATPRLVGRLAPVARQLPAPAPAAAARPRPALAEIPAALAKPEARLKALARPKNVKGAEQETPEKAATNNPFEN